MLSIRPQFLVALLAECMFFELFDYVLRLVVFPATESDEIFSGSQPDQMVER
jgi:hypothetical protein